MTMATNLSLKTGVHLAALKLGARVLFFGLDFTTGGCHWSRPLIMHSFVLLIQLARVVVNHTISVGFAAQILVIAAVGTVLLKYGLMTYVLHKIVVLALVHYLASTGLANLLVGRKLGLTFHVFGDYLVFGDHALLIA